MTQRVLNFSSRLAAASANPQNARNFLEDYQEIAAIAPYAYPEQISNDALFFLSPHIDLCAERPPGINDGMRSRMKAIAQLQELYEQVEVWFRLLDSKTTPASMREELLGQLKIAAELEQIPSEKREEIRSRLLQALA